MDDNTRITSPADEAELVEVAPEQVDQVLAEAAEALVLAAERGNPVADEQPSDEQPQVTPLAGRSKRREAATTGTGLAAGELGRRAVKECMDREAVVNAARRVASRQTLELSDEQVLLWLAEKPGRLKMLGGHLHEMLDAKSLRQLAKLTGGRTRVLELYPAHNRPGLDGVYKKATHATKKVATGGTKKAVHAQHKGTPNREAMKDAAKKVCPQVRGRTELVVARGTKKAAKQAVGDTMRVREAGRSLKDINVLLEKAANPNKVREVGKRSAAKLGAKAVGGAAATGAVFSLVSDAKGLYKGEKSVGLVAENTAWAAGESALTAAASAALTAAAAESIAAGVTVLAGSSLAGTTAMAAGLATLGPSGLGIVCGLVVGFGVKKVREATRG